MNSGKYIKHRRMRGKTTGRGQKKITVKAFRTDVVHNLLSIHTHLTSDYTSNSVSFETQMGQNFSLKNISVLNPFQHWRHMTKCYIPHTHQAPGRGH